MIAEIEDNSEELDQLVDEEDDEDNNNHNNSHHHNHNNGHQHHNNNGVGVGGVDEDDDMEEEEEEEDDDKEVIGISDDNDESDDGCGGVGVGGDGGGDTANVCELDQSNQLTVVPTNSLMSDSADGSNDDSRHNMMVGGDGGGSSGSGIGGSIGGGIDDNMGQTHSVKIVKVVPLPHARSEVWSYFGFIADDDGEIQDKKKAICKICASTLAYSGNTTNLFTHLKAMHPEAQPQKLAPTNRTPRTGKKFGNKRKSDVLDGAGSGQLIVRAIHYSSSPHTNNNNNSSDHHMYSDDNDHQSGGGGGHHHLTLLNHNHHHNHHQKPHHKSQQTTVSLYNNSTDNSSSASTTTTTNHNHHMITSDDITASLVNWLVKDCRPICVVEGKGFVEMLRQLVPGYQVPDTKRLTNQVKKKYDEVRRELILKAMQDE
ncbi:probable serine/threonine-protein kinase DDB_G0271402 [Oppia nitens]|uniref:probable serine/threonine-protein kinase DDB_G0271402 n=1 Tax=Oppia nitens TaxID=1686743 RepID=UPI0023D9C309|nr:probable serine/threonine-protein kinase DDB_G0271402 [Oppia nitens]